MTETIQPAIGKSAFNCPHCGVCAAQNWLIIGGIYVRGIVRLETSSSVLKDMKASPRAASLIAALNNMPDPNEDDIDVAALQKPRFKVNSDNNGNFSRETTNAVAQIITSLNVSECHNLSCERLSIWVDEKLVYPAIFGAANPNKDLTEDIVSDYNEAAAILHASPRGSAALLRLCVQKLCVELGAEGKTIDTNIADLVKKGLSEDVKDALDIVRVTGNESVHPGQMDMRDDVETATDLFELVNYIADRMISEPKRRDKMLAKLPQNKREGIAKRDKKARGGK